MYTYVEVPLAAVRPELRGIVERALKIAATELGIRVPPLRYIRPADGYDWLKGSRMQVAIRTREKIGGAVVDGAVLIRTDRPLDEMAEAAAHECRHVADGQAYSDDAYELNEQKAAHFGREFVQRHGLAIGLGSERWPAAEPYPVKSPFDEGPYKPADKAGHPANVFVPSTGMRIW